MTGLRSFNDSTSKRFRNFMPRFPAQFRSANKFAIRSVSSAGVYR